MSNYIRDTVYVGWNNLSIPKLKQLQFEVYEWIGNFIPHFTEHVITYPY